eukprot:TRINITY_DN1082_c0_g1_i1.p1 TRINITY_DN1082_c0_g1~~TRINITY_DN1082_c0_g1_i1.p1  ORF type:complete len:202 (-),score=72.51 TRINITY_DN1082_c0_g1_i1:96-680(-)
MSSSSSSSLLLLLLLSATVSVSFAAFSLFPPQDWQPSYSGLLQATVKATNKTSELYKCTLSSSSPNTSTGLLQLSCELMQGGGGAFGAYLTQNHTFAGMLIEHPNGDCEERVGDSSSPSWASSCVNTFCADAIDVKYKDKGVTTEINLYFIMKHPHPSSPKTPFGIEITTPELQMNMFNLRPLAASPFKYPTCK